MQGRESSGVIVTEVAQPSFECSPIVLTCNAFYPPKTVELAKFIAEYYVCALGEALSLFIPSSRVDVLHVSVGIHTDIVLSASQQAAYDFASLHPSSLLFGDTGSGKTEIYMKRFEACLNEGKQALFLLPEIGLTPQMKARLKHHFGERVALWHSKISAKQKKAILEQLSNGTVRIIAGTRSALFLPFRALGQIVVDEEHDESYKSSSRPRYNAKDLALLFAQKWGAKVLLGSATPSLTSFHKVPYFRLQGTFFDASTRIAYDEAEGISPKIIHAIACALEANKQVIVFVPTRANFKYITCKACGASVECPYCSVGMSVHTHAHALKCHYCNYTETIPPLCPKCGHDEIIASRMGTAEVAKVLETRFKEHRVQQFDRDEVKTEKELTRILHAFDTKEIDIMVGTQMLSKGHDYHDVGLVVVLGTDALLNRSDFRAREKTLALVKQIAGRSGRKGQGEVLIQTKNSDFFKQYLDDFEAFLTQELSYRKGLYPPFKKMLRLMVAHKNEAKVQKNIEAIVGAVEAFSKVELIGHGRSTIAKIADKYRYEVLVRSDSSKALLEFAHHIASPQIEIDMDPLSFS